MEENKKVFFIIEYIFFLPVLVSLYVSLRYHCDTCARNIYGISRYQHISEHANRILCCSLVTSYNLGICRTMYCLMSSSRPKYFFDELQFGRSARLFNLIIPRHRGRIWWIVSGVVALLHASYKTGLMCTTVYLWCHNYLFCIRPETFFCVACILVEVVWSNRLLFIAVFWVSTNCRPH
jgi:hypothetical protein